jgi:hypothetical protein
MAVMASTQNTANLISALLGVETYNFNHMPKLIGIANRFNNHKYLIYSLD